jgi:hypothetical protein
MTVILDPTNETVPVSRQITPRSGQVSGVVGLMDIRKPRGNILLDELEKLLAEREPDIEIRRYAKPTFTKPCPDDLRAQMKAECDFVVEGLAD